MPRTLLLESTLDEPINGSLIYDRADHAFAFRLNEELRVDELVHTSLLMGTIQLETSTRTGRLLYAWGYSPMQGWEERPIEPLPTDAGGLAVVGLTLTEGVATPVATVGETVVSFDPAHGVVRVTVRGGPECVRKTQIASGVGALRDSRGALAGIELAPADRE